jgi:hypothetical protein
LSSEFFLLRAFHPQHVEQRAFGLLLAGCDFDQTPTKKGSALLHL